MILVDFNLISIVSLTSWYGKNPKKTLTVNEAAGIIIGSLQDYQARFAHFTPMVLACDSRSYWRQKVFPHYKLVRKKNRATQSQTKTNQDWNVIHAAMDMVKKYAVPTFHVVEVDGAEGDDVIAVLTQQFADTKDIIIVSSDKDFAQLHTYKKVKQFSPQVGQFVTYDPVLQIREHIIRGDYGDSIPNFLMAADTFVVGQRQKGINTVKLQEWVLEDDYLKFCDTPAKRANYERNRQLIDFNYIPKDIKEAILTEYGK
jgi:hypothetical protein